MGSLGVRAAGPRRLGMLETDISAGGLRTRPEYRHFPEVGIAPELRKGLRAQDDYDDLFAAYRRTILPTTLPTQREILNLLQQYRRIALTCFEAESQRCHRRHLAEAISKLPGFTYDVIHL